MCVSIDWNLRIIILFLSSDHPEGVTNTNCNLYFSEKSVCCYLYVQRLFLSIEIQVIRKLDFQDQGFREYFRLRFSEVREEKQMGCGFDFEG